MKTTRMAVFVAAASAAVSLLSASVALAQDAAAAPVVAAADAQAAEYTAITKCAWCHGPQGHSISPIYPALAGQKAWYILEQLQAFKAQTRADPYARGMMWGMAAQLDDTQMTALADYYSKQTPFASMPTPFTGSSAAAKIAHGKSVYNDGDPDHGVPPCAACHLGDASGSEQFPRLAGQHASYLLKQLRALNTGSRQQVVMNGVAAPLHVPEMEAVSLYLESLH
jgi:cytochrome c553